MRWDLVDYFESLDTHKEAVAYKTVDLSADYLSVRDSGPYVPEVLLVEMVAQTGGTLFGLGLNFTKEVILAKVLNVTFPVAVKAPGQLKITARFEYENEAGASIIGQVLLESIVVADVNLMLAAVERLPLESTDIKKGKSVVFSDAFLKRYRVLEIASNKQGLS